MTGLLQKISTAKKRAGISKGGKPWFRGVRRNVSLLPKILRFGHTPKYVNRIENELYAEFANSVNSYVEGIKCLNSWDYLCAMQHYGVSTRLLDWSERLDVALYFAVSSHQTIDAFNSDEWPRLWVLNPYRLNYIYIKDNLIFDKADCVPYDYYEELVRQIPTATWPHVAPIAIHPGFTNRRIMAQSGCFTFHGSDFRPLNEQIKETKEFWHLEDVIIDPHDFSALKSHFARSPKSHEQLFPDLYGFVMSLNASAKVY
jgi:hypothetical protein